MASEAVTSEEKKRGDGKKNSQLFARQICSDGRRHILLVKGKFSF